MATVLHHVVINFLQVHRWMIITMPDNPKKKRKVVQKEQEPEEHFTVYAIGASDEDLIEDNRRVHSDAEETLAARTRAKKKAPKETRQKSVPPEREEASASSHRDNQRKDDEADDVVGSDYDYVTQLKRQLEIRDREMEALQRKNEETQDTLKSLYSFLVDKGLMANKSGGTSAPATDIPRPAPPRVYIASTGTHKSDNPVQAATSSGVNADTAEMHASKRDIKEIVN